MAFEARIDATVAFHRRAATQRSADMDQLRRAEDEAFMQRVRLHHSAVQLRTNKYNEREHHEFDKDQTKASCILRFGCLSMTLSSVGNGAAAAHTT